MTMNQWKEKLSQNYQEQKQWVKTKWKEAEKNPRLEPILHKADAIKKSVTERIGQFF